jgi:hypothetical protein
VSDIILRNVPHADEGATEVVNFTIIVDEADWVGRFDQLQVFRSIEGPSGPFEELTGASWASPRLPQDGGDEPTSPVTGPLVVIVGKVLEVVSFGQSVFTTFTGSDPLTYTQVATQIEAQSFGRLLSYVDALGKLVIESTYPGLASLISIPESDAAVILGLPTIEPDNTAQGHDPRLPLMAGITSYAFRDPLGSRDYEYRTRLLNSMTAEASDFSISFSANDAIGVGLDNTIVGYVLLAELTGKSQRNNQVSIFNDFDGSTVNGMVITGATITVLTDESGRAEFTLVRGQKVTVSIQGTTLVRSITVPSDPALSTFNLFDPSIGEVDVFRAAVPNIITAERRTL